LIKIITVEFLSPETNSPNSVNIQEITTQHSMGDDSQMAYFIFLLLPLSGLKPSGRRKDMKSASLK
jgi:hypothetical protein